MANPLRDAILTLLRGALIGFDQMFTSVIEILTLRTTDAAGNIVPKMNLEKILQEVFKISESLSGFCLTIAGICLLIELVQILTKVDVIKWEHGLKVCVKMALSVTFIHNAQYLLLAFYYQSVVWIDSISASTTSFSIGVNAAEDLELFIGAISGMWQILGLFMTCLVLVLAIKACGIIVQVIAFMRMFEILIMIAVSPLPFAFFPLGNGDGSGFSRITAKFLRSFAGVCLQGVMMIVCLKVFDVIIGTALNESIVEMNKVLKDELRNNVNWWQAIAMGPSGIIYAAVQKARWELSGHTPNLMFGYKVSADVATNIVSELCFMMLLGSIALVMSIQKCGSWAKSILDGM